MSPETARRPWWRLARGLLSLAVLCTLIAAFLTVLDGQFGIKLVYSFSIGLSCWVVIDGGRTALAAWRRRRGVLDNERVGWAGVVPLIIVGAVLGPLLGMAIGDALTGG